MSTGNWLAGLIAVVFAAMPARAEIEEELVVGNWNGGAFYAGGHFSHCALTASYASGLRLSLGWNDGGLTAALEGGDWDLVPGRSWRVGLAIDEAWSSTASVVAVGRGVVRLDLGADEGAVEAFRRGRMLAVATPTATFRFRLDGSGAAIDAVRRCHRRHAALAAAAARRANPFDGGEEEAGAHAPAPHQTPRPADLIDIRAMEPAPSAAGAPAKTAL